MYRTILVPIDIGQAGRAPEALALARALLAEGGTVHLLYVVADVPSFISTQLPEGIQEAHVAEAGAALDALAQDLPAPAETHVLTGHVSTTILDFAERIEADCIVIASHRPGFQDYFLGSTASRVVRHAPCTVVVAR
ncbi:MAG TPA: universal stress protein [Paracoccaceae bacterium]|nr:universal stress protein [Paracoccaceae bacterium]